MVWVCVHETQRQTQTDPWELRRGGWVGSAEAFVWQSLPERRVHDRLPEIQPGRGSSSSTYYKFQNV